MQEPVTWTREDHTAAKHEVLLAFFNKWVSTHSETFAKRGSGLVRIYDGFAGPGVYTGGEPGSPLILMRALCTNPNLNGRWSEVRYEFSFVEKSAARATRLRQELLRLETQMQKAGVWTNRILWLVTCGRYEDNVPKRVPGNSALFLFLDPFGYSHAPMTLTQDVIQQPKSDTLIFVPLSFVNRFVDREGQARALDRFFGTSAWRNVPDGPTRPAALLELFQEQLRAGGLEWVHPFQLRPEEGGNTYWLIGASNHLAGFESIKEGFWAADPVNGQGFSTPRSPAPGQEVFEFVEPGRPAANTRPLLDALRAHFGDEPFKVEDAIGITLRSRFLASHLKRMTLAPAEKRGELKVDRPPGVRQFKEGKGITMRFV
jgi:three-Cys-motif partner protein